MSDDTKPRSVAGARRLFDRPPPEGYLEQWAELLAQPLEKKLDATTPVVVFRVGVEWLALPCGAFRENTSTQPIHRIPHREDPVLLGIMSIRGELHLAVSLHALLEIEKDTSDGPGEACSRMVVIEKDAETYVAPVEEVHGLHRIAEGELAPAPVTVEKTAATHTRGLFMIEDKSVALLDDELVFCNLRRHVE